MTDLHPGREHLALALDVDSAAAALAVLRRLRPWFSVAKVGLELFASEGPVVLELARDEGFDVFADLKLHDIPTTVGRAARAVGRHGARFLTVHAAGGPVMLGAAMEGFTGGALEAGQAVPVTLGVTVLTSDADASPAVFDERLGTVVAVHCPGLVCSALDVARAKAEYPDAFAVVPGIRASGGDHDDQARVATAAEALRCGADLLVIGRTVTAADDVEAAAQHVADEVVGALLP
jgi:orotidine-5'-phosphate decarboxylase